MGKLKLESIGFNWSMYKHDEEWYLMFDQLKKFHAREGHCNVHDDNPELSKLFCWVKNVVFRKTKMSKDKRLKLESLGIIVNKTDEEKWNLMFEELREYQAHEGHCD